MKKWILFIALLVGVSTSSSAYWVTVHGSSSQVPDPNNPSNSITRCTGSSGTCFRYEVRTVAGPDGDVNSGTIEFYEDERVVATWSFSDIKLVKSGTAAEPVTDVYLADGKKID